MGRAKGSAAAVLSAPARRRVVVSGPSAALAEERLLHALRTDAYDRGRVRLAGATEREERRVAQMLNSGMPRRWAWDTGLADGAPALASKRVRAALDHYLSARLREDLPILMGAGLLSADEALALEDPFRADDYRAWAALRAVHLLNESWRLQELAATSSREGAAAAFHVSGMCERVAREDLQSPPTTGCEWAAVALALAHSHRAENERMRLYEGETIRQHRELLAVLSGREVKAPVLALDFEVLGAIQGLWGEMYALTHSGYGGGKHNLVWVNYQKVNEELVTNDGYSPLLFHELVHTLQGGSEPPLKDSHTMAERTLDELLCEGATEAYTQQKMSAFIAKEGKAMYPGHQVFVKALASAAAGGDATRASQLVADLALCSHQKRVHAAARMLCGHDDADTVAALTAAASAYASCAYDEEGRGGSPLGYVKQRSQLELTERAGALLQVVRAPALIAS